MSFFYKNECICPEHGMFNPIQWGMGDSMLAVATGGLYLKQFLKICYYRYHTRGSGVHCASTRGDDNISEKK